MKRIRKGEWGYLQYRRTTGIAWAVLAVALIVGIYFGAYRYFGTNQNLFTILAAVSCLPAAKLIVNAIMYVRAKGCSAKLHEQVEGLGISCTLLYDLVFTSYEKTYTAGCAAVTDSAVLLFAEDASTDLKAASNHVRRMLQQNGIHGVTVQFLQDFGTYRRRLLDLDEAGKQQRSPEEETKNQEKVQEIINLLFSISL